MVLILISTANLTFWAAGTSLITYLPLISTNTKRVTKQD
jgi:hypothetical protein